MASPTAAELRTQLQNKVALLDNYLANQTVLTDIDTLVQSLETDFAGEDLAAIDGMRAAAARVAATARAILGPWVKAYAHHVVGVPERDPIAAFSRVYDNWVDNTLSVDDRAFTFASPSAGGSNVGNGLMYRLNVDENNHEIESQHADAKVADCVADGFHGSNRHEEIFEIRGAAGPVDLLDYKAATGQGSGLLERADFTRSVSSRDSLALNSSFDQVTIAAGQPTTGSPATLVAGDTVNNWTADDVTNLQSDVDDTYRNTHGVATPKGLRLLTSATLTQTFANANLVLDPNVPYFWQLAWQRESTADGTLTVSVGGNATATVNVTTGTNGVWNVLTPTLNQNLWPANFEGTDEDIVIALASNTTGDVVIDDFLLVPMFSFDRSWYSIVGGSTKFLLDDTFTWTDSIASDSKIQKWLWIAFNLYLPHSGTPSLADPA